jgi:nucleoside-triphosphatase
MTTNSSILLTGKPGVGKSSCLRHVADRCNLTVDGVISGELRENGKRAGFEMQLIGPGTRGLLASPEVESEIRFGTPRSHDGRPRLGVTHDFLKTDVCPHLRALIGNVSLIVVDEIGSMQASYPEFLHVVHELIAADTPLLASVSLADDPSIEALRNCRDIPTIELSLSNRDLIAAMLTAYVPAWAKSAG